MTHLDPTDVPVWAEAPTELIAVPPTDDSSLFEEPTRIQSLPDEWFESIRLAMPGPEGFTMAVAPR